MKTPPPVQLPRSARIVIKLGTGVLTSGIGQLDRARIEAIAGQVAGLRRDGARVVIVSSGAVGLGMGRLGLKHRPAELARKQACAAIGQRLLVDEWQRAFDPHGITIAQVLLTHDDLRLRRRYVGVSRTIEQLLAYETVPVINENDAVSAAEIRFGDNDTLSAMVASLLGADFLFILSTAPGLVDLDGTGEIIPHVRRITPEIEGLARGTTSVTAVGGMVSKIAAAKLATKAHCGVFIASGAEPDILPRLIAGEAPGTYFEPDGRGMDARKRWLAFFQRPCGTIRVNDCAVPVLQREGRSLLAVGITGVEGAFAEGDIVDIAAPDGTVIGRGVARFDAEAIRRIAGKSSDEIRRLFPGRRRVEVVHRNDLVLL